MVPKASQVAARLRSGSGARWRGRGVHSVGSADSVGASAAVAPVSAVCGVALHPEVAGQADGAGVHRPASGSSDTATSNSGPVVRPAAENRPVSVAGSVPAAMSAAESVTWPLVVAVEPAVRSPAATGALAGPPVAAADSVACSAVAAGRGQSDRWRRPGWSCRCARPRRLTSPRTRR
ncbi:hypothetical protein GCM10027614_58220 [Micromonospora vulcania]